MRKYNFYKLRADIYRGAALPKDVNEPIKEILRDAKALSTISVLEKKENSCQCGKITAFHADFPLRRYEIRTNYGMVEGIDIIEELPPSGDDRYFNINQTHIKNRNLSMAKDNNSKGEQNV